MKPTAQPNAFAPRALALHAALFVLVFLAFILPVIVGTGALLPVWLSGAISLVLAVAALADAARMFFAPSQRRARSLRLLSACAALTYLIGWAVWLFIFNNFAAAGSAVYRIGTFSLTVAAVLSVFVAAIAVLDIKK